MSAPALKALPGTEVISRPVAAGGFIAAGTEARPAAGGAPRPCSFSAPRIRTSISASMLGVAEVGEVQVVERRVAEVGVS